ncbi:DUF1800 domain-containing protein, partial [Bacillus paranthracis]|uniref:DUF1800 domain-containing protein n=1 Tax=Bacillus paranthracis TaxID=2026186 RepID=UPI002110F688
LRAAAGSPGDQGQPLFSLPSPDGWPDGADEFGVGAVPAHVRGLPADRLGQPPPPGRIQL